MYFSRNHFLVEVNPPLCRLLDMNSHNGTFVNRQRVESADLHDGDEIKAGHTLLRVSVKQPGVEHLAHDRRDPADAVEVEHHEPAPRLHVGDDRGSPRDPVEVVPWI